MAKGASTENKLGALHAKLAVIFTQVLETYEARLAMVEQVKSAEEVTEDMMAMLLSANIEPNPAMLGAISRFLKDNSIMFDSEEIQKLSDTESRLVARRASRKGLVELTDLRLVADG